MKVEFKGMLVNEYEGTYYVLVDEQGVMINVGDIVTTRDGVDLTVISVSPYQYDEVRLCWPIWTESDVVEARGWYMPTVLGLRWEVLA